VESDWISAAAILLAPALAVYMKHRLNRRKPSK
jgi:hypothetical protein